ncbi:Dienelactone hydrolase [Hoeflea phototrophica DFL-43]|jgi:carboxymethylenebutenolidase|uniref:Dienelactone hydrolase n=1 Tax=Hoeflea phototrophica (strain DSM 17068 / NCIMB 14078 / DFL-43) TaxID=411684 RepID=A9D3B4_HOEPD|nr:dienelactone hydrolase family protein [Hoeflea phototrophica]EDQ33654.1 Dienelactone hydrolase [Hoeflea phototrophica DFL-43]
MPRQPAITQAMIKAYDDYTHLTLDRRGFMNKLKTLTGSAAAAAAVAPMLAASSARAAMVAEDDARLEVSDITFDGATSEMRGQLSIPVDATGPLPAVVVIHENRGLNEHIRDVARRLALEGFATLAVDFLSPLGGTPDDEDKAREMIRTLEGSETIANATAARSFLAGHEKTNGSVGAIGFCWGGGLVNNLAVADADLGAGVAYYGRQASAADVPTIKAPLMLHYAGLDERINSGIEDYRAALEAAGKRFELHMYEGVNHAFNNDTSAARYDKAAAELAWSRTVAFLRDNLG